MSRRTPAKLVYRYCRVERERGKREAYLMSLQAGLGPAFDTDQAWRALSKRMGALWHHLTAAQRSCTPFPGE